MLHGTEAARCVCSAYGYLGQSVEVVVERMTRMQAKGGVKDEGKGEKSDDTARKASPMASAVGPRQTDITGSPSSRSTKHPFVTRPADFNQGSLTHNKCHAPTLGLRPGWPNAQQGWTM